MTKIAHSAATRARKKKVLKQAKGYFSDRSKQFQQARRALMHALVYNYRDRKNRKREFRALWIARLNAACRAEGLLYSRFMNGLKKANVKLDRKMLSELAIKDIKVFKKLIEIAKG
jgi:large subunit ribosomal protein L20